MSRFQRFGTENAQRFTNTNDHAQTTEHMMCCMRYIHIYRMNVCMQSKGNEKLCAHGIMDKKGNRNTEKLLSVHMREKEELHIFMMCSKYHRQANRPV